MNASYKEAYLHIIYNNNFKNTNSSRRKKKSRFAFRINDIIGHEKCYDLS